MTDAHFTERTALERGFAEVYRGEILPVLERHEAERKVMRRKALQGMGITGFGGGGGLVAGVQTEADIGAVIGGAVATVGTFGVKSYYESKWRKGLGKDILPILARFLGEMEYGRQRIDLGPFRELGVVPGYDRSSLEDPVAGSHLGLDWAMSEATLRDRYRDSKGRTRTRTVFRGLLIRIAVENPAPRIFFARDRGSAFNWVSEQFSSARRGLDRVELGDPAFEEVYEVYSDDPEAARAYLVDQVLWGLKQFAAEEADGERYIACGFMGDAFYLALPRSGDFLAIGSLFKPVNTAEADVRQALSDLDLPRRLIGWLTGRASPSMAAPAPDEA